MDISYKYRLIVLCILAFVATMLVFKPILKIAKMKGIVDNPEGRKLQKTPVPVMGGIAVFFGIAFGLCFYKTMITYTVLFPVLGAMMVMLYLGAIDDILSVKPYFRFGFEILVAIILIYGLRCCIVNFQGLWGIDFIPVWLGVILSVITFLGTVNAINMIDGVDGLSSAFCILILGCFGIICFLASEYSFAVLSAVTIGALLPFFLHNVFGRESKMFMGDGGTMMLGTIISAMVFVILRRNFALEERFPALDFSRIAFCIAVLSIPIADTLRVMAERIAHKSSPFSPDKTHLHHYLVQSGFSHLAVTTIEIGLDLAVIGVFFGVWALGADKDIQLYSVIAAASLADFVLVAIIRKNGRK